MDDFIFKWRFKEDKYDNLPKNHLEQIKPLDSEGAKFIDNFINANDLHSDAPFKKGFFKTIDKAKVFENNNQQIKKWLYNRAIPFDQDIYLSWAQDTAVKTKWKMLVKYWDSFYYGGSDDLTVFPASLEWSLLFYHEDEIYFGTNKNYKVKQEYSEELFIW